MGIYILAIIVLVILFIITAIIYEDNENWELDIPTGLSMLLIPIGVICKSGILIFIGFVIWVAISFYLKSLVYQNK